MTQQEAAAKDLILQFLFINNNTRSFTYCDKISKVTEINKSSVSAYCEEMGALGYVIFNKNLQGCDVKLTDRGLHYYNNGGFSEEYRQRVEEITAIEEERRDERLTRKVVRRTSRGSLAISILAFLMAAFALIAQIFDWFKN